MVDRSGFIGDASDFARLRKALRRLHDEQRVNSSMLKEMAKLHCDRATLDKFRTGKTEKLNKALAIRLSDYLATHARWALLLLDPPATRTDDDTGTPASTEVPIRHTRKTGRGEIRPVKFMFVKAIRTTDNVLSQIERRFSHHPSISMIFKMQGDWDYLIKIDEIPDDMADDIIDDLRNTNLAHNSLTYTAGKQLL